MLRPLRGNPLARLIEFRVGSECVCAPRSSREIIVAPHSVCLKFRFAREPTASSARCLFCWLMRIQSSATNCGGTDLRLPKKPNQHFPTIRVTSSCCSLELKSRISSRMPLSKGEDDSFLCRARALIKRCSPNSSPAAFNDSVTPSV